MATRDCRGGIRVAFEGRQNLRPRLFSVTCTFSSASLKEIPFALLCHGRLARHSWSRDRGVKEERPTIKVSAFRRYNVTCQQCVILLRVDSPQRDFHPGCEQKTLNVADSLALLPW